MARSPYSADTWICVWRNKGCRPCVRLRSFETVSKIVLFVSLVLTTTSSSYGVNAPFGFFSVLRKLLLSSCYFLMWISFFGFFNLLPIFLQVLIHVSFSASASQRVGIWLSNSFHAPCKRIQETLGFWIQLHLLRIPCTWFQSLSVEMYASMGFRISCAVFQIPKPRIPDCASNNSPVSGIRIP